jgi:P-type E1-E2 ATPase
MFIHLGMCAGGFIGLGALYSTLIFSDPALPFAVSRLLGGLAFSLGLILVVVTFGNIAGGSIMLLSEGDRVPADARIVAANDLMLDESLLTGESLPVEKRPDMPVYSGTLVVKGQGRAEVTATGPGTEFGRIGQSLVSLDIDKTRLQRETARIVKGVAAFALALCLLLAAYYIATRGDWPAGILAGITLAMAILPEEFPVVLTVFLALGAWRIGRHGVLTRRMPAIEARGARPRTNGASPSKARRKRFLRCAAWIQRRSGSP